jgi:hypothetical protein
VDPVPTLKAVEAEGAVVVVVGVVQQSVWTGGKHCCPQRTEQGFDTPESGS